MLCWMDSLLIIQETIILSFLDAVLQAAEQSGSLYTAMFSPAESSVIAVGGSDGAVLYDIRNIKR